MLMLTKSSGYMRKPMKRENTVHNKTNMGYFCRAKGEIY